MSLASSLLLKKTLASRGKSPLPRLRSCRGFVNPSYGHNFSTETAPTGPTSGQFHSLLSAIPSTAPGDSGYGREKGTTLHAGVAGLCCVNQNLTYMVISLRV